MVVPGLTASSKDDFDNRIIKCVDEVLETFGPKVRRSIVYHMRRSFNLKRYEIPQKPESFSSALEKIFGLIGQDIEKDIAKRVADEFGLTAGAQLSFVKAVEAASKKHRDAVQTASEYEQLF